MDGLIRQLRFNFVQNFKVLVTKIRHIRAQAYA